MSVQSNTLAEPTMTFPQGVFTYTLSDGSPTVEFDGQGKTIVTFNGEVIVVAAYKVMGDVFEVVDESGPYADPESGVGQYKWGLTGKTLTFSLLADKSKSRAKSFALPWQSCA